MQTYGVVEVLLHTFLTSTLEGGEWRASHPGRFTPEERTSVPVGEEAGWAPEPVWSL
jgi:hypothetical protein